MNTRSFLPPCDSSIDDGRQKLVCIVERLLAQIANLADRTTAAGALHALQKRARATHFDDKIHADAIGELQHFFMPSRLLCVVDGLNGRFGELLTDVLELFVAGRCQDDFQPGCTGELQSKHAYATGAFQSQLVLFHDTMA